jgi:hypothetical protein
VQKPSASATSAPRVIHIALPYCEDHPSLRNSWRAMLKRTMSRINATKVTSAANEELSAMRTVPERWYSAPQKPNSTARPDRPAAMGCKMRVNVRLWMDDDDNSPNLKVCQFEFSRILCIRRTRWGNDILCELAFRYNRTHRIDTRISHWLHEGNKCYSRLGRIRIPGKYVNDERMGETNGWHTRTNKTIAEKQKNKPGMAGEAAIS